MATTTSRKRTTHGRAPVVRDHVLVTLAQNGGRATAAELGASNGYVQNLVGQGFLVRKGTVKTTDGPGRPAVVFGLTQKGRGRARTAARQAA